jgi:hypothetical protein
VRVRAFLAYLLATILAASGLSIGLAVAPAHAVDPVPVTGTVVDATSDAGVPGRTSWPRVRRTPKRP